MLKSIIFIIILYSQYYISFSQSTFSAFKIEMEANVKKIAEQMTSIYSNRCNTTILNCQTKSYNYCQGTAAKQCVDHFPTPSGCVGRGASVSLLSSVRFPNTTDLNSLNQQQRQFVCSSAELQSTFQSLDSINNGRFTLSFFGTSLGSFRHFPSSTQQRDENGNCRSYDPRYRPWYVTGTSSGKNVILIIDVSGSMATNNKIATAISSAKAVLNTLSNNDFIGVIKFSSTATALSSNQIKRATSAYKNQLINSVDKLNPSGSTNYQAAFNLGFNMLKQAQADQFGAPCSNAQNIFLFLTDGAPTSGQTTFSGLNTTINSQNGPFDIKLFTYGMDTDLADLSLLKDLACQYKGIFFSIPSTASSSQLLTLMRSYYEYIAVGVDITQPQWTQPYQDAFGFGNLVTVSFPAYYTENGIRKILGVAGIDVSVDYATKKYSLSIDQIQKQLLNQAPCYSSTLAECDIQYLRPISSKCGTTCTTQGFQTACFSAITTNIFLTPIDTNSGLCCGLTVGALIGIIVGVVVCVIIIIIVLICIIKQMKAKQQEIQGLKNDQMAQGNNNIIVEQKYGSVPSPYNMNSEGTNWNGPPPI